MSLVSIDIAKRHLRVLEDDEDVEIALYLDAAESAVCDYLDRVVYVGVEPTGGDGTAIELTSAITAAILLMLGDMYAIREPDPKLTGDAVLPRAVRALLAPYRVWRLADEAG